VRAALKGGDESQVIAAFEQAYTWDPGVKFPSSTQINSEEANRMVGPGNPSATLAAQITGLRLPDPGTVIKVGTEVPGAVVGSAASSVVSSVAGPVMVWVAKLGFVGLGGLLLVAGLYRASERGQSHNGGLVDAAKSGAALAA
jgi:hypothetical protein